MSPMSTRRTSHGSTGSGSSSMDSEVMLLLSPLSSSLSESPRKQARHSKPPLTMLQRSSSFREMTRMEEDDDDDEHHSDCWYELKEDDDDENDDDKEVVIDTTRSVPHQNTPMVRNTTLVATRLLFQEEDVPEDKATNVTAERSVVVPPLRQRRRQYPPLSKLLSCHDASHHSGKPLATTVVPPNGGGGSSNSCRLPSPQGRKRNSIERRPTRPSHPISSASVVDTTPVTGRKLYHPHHENHTTATTSMSFDDDDDEDDGIVSTSHPNMVSNRSATTNYHSQATLSSSAALYSSPKLSPNSYITMDGRFVQSKNPFSSPMIVHHSINSSNNNNSSSHGHTMASLPVFPMTTNDHEDPTLHRSTQDCSSPTAPPSLQPKPQSSHPSTTMEVVVAVPQGTPVSQATVGLQAFSFHSSNIANQNQTDGEEGSILFPSSSSTASSLLYRRNSYVCSPIIESPVHPDHHSENSSTTTVTTSNRMILMPATDTIGDDELPTAGSLHKVRRIHKSDDIFAASHHHLSNLRETVLQQQHLSGKVTMIDTTTTNMMKLGYDEEEDISPTDVTSTTLFGQPQRFFAPTPVVPKHGPPPTPIKPSRGSNVVLFTTATKQPTPPQFTPYPHHSRPPQSPSRRDASTTNHTSPSSPVGLPPILTRKLLQPRTPLVSLNAVDRNSNNLPSQQHQPSIPYWQKQQSNATRTCSDNQNEVWMFESDNSCGYTDTTTGAHDSAFYNNHSGQGLNTTMELQPQQAVATSRFYSDFDIIGELGHGSFGSVYKVLSRLDGCMYAIKAAKRQAKGIADRDRMLKEVYALAALSDQADTANFHIVRYHQAWMEDDRLYIQTELCSGTLSDEMNRVPPILNVPRRYKLLREILLALDFIHRHNMVHLDIKPENIFIKNDQYKLGDFGLVTKASSSQDVEEGDSRYMSMEVLSGDNRSDLTKSDIFSLGITMYEICLGRSLPVNGEEWQDIRAGKLSPLPNTDHDMTNIIKRMLDPNPMNRPTPASLLKHPQLLSDEEKALNAERTKVIHANIQLAAQQQQMHFGVPVPKRALTRANTWSGSSLPYL